MEVWASLIFYLLIISLLLFSAAKSDSERSGCVFFFDGQTHQYLRPSSPPPLGVGEEESMSPPEIGAAVSVLLGFAPPPSLSAASSSKLNEVLMPNPFNRPRAVLMLEVAGVKVDPTHSILSSAVRRKVDLNSDNAGIELPVEEVAAVLLDNGSEDATDKELTEFASWLGGSYEINSPEALSGELVIPLGTSSNVTLHLSEKADRQFLASILVLFRNTQRALEMHDDLSHASRRHAELIFGCFDGIKALQSQYESKDVLQQRVEVFLVLLSKLITSLQASYKDQIVGVIFFKDTPYSKAEALLNVMFTSWPSVRLLAENQVSMNATNATRAEAALVRRTLAWVTGIILLISTFLGIYLLLNMPLTRDTLLYSNVKLD